MAAFTVSVSETTVAKLDRLAEKLDRPSANIAAQAIEDFVTREEWQIAEIEAGLAEADRGEFVEAAEMIHIAGRFLKPDQVS